MDMDGSWARRQCIKPDRREGRGKEEKPSLGVGSAGDLAKVKGYRLCPRLRGPCCPGGWDPKAANDSSEERKLLGDRKRRLGERRGSSQRTPEDDPCFNDAGHSEATEITAGFLNACNNFTFIKSHCGISECFCFGDLGP